MMMFVSDAKLIGIPLVGLQTGQTLAIATGLVLDYRNLELVALQCLLPDRKRAVVMVRDLREWAKGVLLINSEDDLSEASEIVRLQPLLEQNFQLRGAAVRTESGRHLGRIEGFTINTETAQVQKLYVRPPIWRSLLTGTLTIDRSQVVDVSPRLVTVRDATIAAVAPLAQPVAPE